MSGMEGMSMWDVGVPQKLMEDGTIDWELTSYENHGADVLGRTDYRLWSTDQSSYFVPRSAHLQVDFTVTSSTGASDVSVLQDKQRVLCSNGFYLFEDARLLVQDVEQHHIIKPGKAAHMNMLLEAGQEYMDSIANNAHIYLDRVSDLGATGTPVVQAIDPVEGLTGATGLSPVGMYYETQYQREQVGADSSHIGVTSVNKNPNFDESFKRKLDRQVSAGSGYQQAFLPLRHIFPSLDTDRVLQGSKIEVQLNKINNVKEALFGDNGSDASQIKIKRVRLWIARVRPSFDALAKAQEMIKASPKVDHEFENFRMYTYPYTSVASGEQVWQLVHKQNKPTKVLIGFQFQARTSNEKLNPLKFDLLGDESTTPQGIINNIYMRHNGKQVPNQVYDPTADHTRILQELYRVANSDTDPSISSCITYENWREMYPLFVFDLSALEGSAYESRSQSVLDLYWTLSTAAKANYTVFALVYSEAKATYDYSSGVTTVRTI